MIIATAGYVELTIASIVLPDLEAFVADNENISCATIPSFVVFPCIAVAIFEFQVLRALFEVFPFEVLSLNHGVFTYLLTASIPMITGIFQLLIYMSEGGICQKMHLNQLLVKLNITTEMKMFIFPKLNPILIFSFFIVVLELLIRLRKNLSIIKKMVHCKLYLTKDEVLPLNEEAPTVQNAEIMSQVKYFSFHTFIVFTLAMGIFSMYMFVVVSIKCKDMLYISLLMLVT